MGHIADTTGSHPEMAIASLPNAHSDHRSLRLAARAIITSRPEGRLMPLNRLVPRGGIRFDLIILIELGVVMGCFGSFCSVLKLGARLPFRPQRRTFGQAFRAYDSDAIREFVRMRGAWANIPPKENCKNPICFSPCLYRERNHVERFFNRIKHCRRIATRCEKLAAIYLAFVKLASIRLWLRAIEPTS